MIHGTTQKLNLWHTLFIDISNIAKSNIIVWMMEYIENFRFLIFNQELRCTGWTTKHFSSPKMMRCVLSIYTNTWVRMTGSYHQNCSKSLYIVVCGRYFCADSSFCYINIDEYFRQRKTKKKNNSFCVLWDNVASAILAWNISYLPCEECFLQKDISAVTVPYTS